MAGHSRVPHGAATSSATPGPSGSRITVPRRETHQAAGHGIATFGPRVGSLGDGVPGFKTSFDTSTKGGGAFKSISENFSANPANGTMALTIPIRVSSARAKLEPELALSYDSGGGNGPFGFGWGISLPSIYRKTNLSVPLYGDEDQFAFSGADILHQLTQTGAPVMRSETTALGDFDVAAYRSRFDTGSVKIERWTSTADESHVHWRTITSDNKTSVFGDSDSTRIVDNALGSKRIFSWLLSRSYDALGNAIDYEYKAEDANGVGSQHEGDLIPAGEQNYWKNTQCRQKYIKRIKYGNRKPNRVLDTWNVATWPDDWMFEVVFDYGEHSSTESPSTVESAIWSLRQDPFSETHAGFEVRNCRICRRILMFHHFPGRVKASENMTFSTTLQYEESRRRTVLNRVTMAGHSIGAIDSTGAITYWSKSLPPWSFQYTGSPDVTELGTVEAKTFQLLKLPTSEAKISEWLDLNGEGMPGLLTKLDDGTLLYQRNCGIAQNSDDESDHGESQFSQPLVLSQHPSLIDFGFQDLDRNGHLNCVVRDEKGAPQGYYERTDSDTWSTYSEFPQTPCGLEWQRLVDIDLTGDGLPDILFDSGDPSHPLLWQKNLGKGGHSVARQISCPTARPEIQPRLCQGPEILTYVADMTGSGMSDLVEVTRSSVRYWPNYGHGCFGLPVAMDNFPVLANQELFEHSRLRFLDVDGSGPTDMLYILPDGGAMLYYNEAGNSWSGGVTISALPALPSLSAAFTLDILGRGTSCLCWSDPGGSDSNKVMYLDLMGDTKPHLLESYTNGLGATTKISYKPSTSYYVEDERQGFYWTTRLPFPVQCVSKTTVLDEVTGNQQSTEYTYHNGCYDPIEKQFAGFEMVEIVEAERIVISAAETYEPPVVVTKTWFSVGLEQDIDATRFHNKSHLVSKSKESTLLPVDCHRALRGKSLRTEVYSIDGTADTSHPFRIQEDSYHLRIQQAMGPNKYNVVQLIPQETAETQYDRQNMSDAQTTHLLNLKTNDYGDVEESLRIVYPRRVPLQNLPEQVKKNHAAGNVTHVQTWYTNAVLESNNFRKPHAWRQQEHEVLNFDFQKFGLSISLVEAQAFGFAGLSTVKSDTVWKQLRTENRAVYRDSELKTTLPDGQLEAFSLLDQTFDLSLSSEIVEKIALGLLKCGISDKAEDLVTRGGYSRLAGSDAWWIPSARHYFCDQAAQAETGKELQEARRSFYSPRVSRDALGNLSRMKMDDDSLLVESLEDAAGNTQQFRNDYEHLQPYEMVDANLNRVGVRFDPLGSLSAHAILGKASNNDPDADSLEDFTLDADGNELEDILKDPNGDTARRLLGHANMRIFQYIDRFAEWESNQEGCGPHGNVPLPACVISLRRALSQGRSTKSDIAVHVRYLDGHGAVVREFQLGDPEDSAQMWLVPGATAIDKNGRVICQYQPWYSTSAQFSPSTSPEVDFAMSFHDVLGRLVATRAADGTWTKTTISPWCITEHDAGSLILQANPQEDPDVGSYLARVSSDRYTPTWYEKKKAGTPQEQLSAQKSMVYADTVATTFLGCCGLPVMRQVRTSRGIVHTRTSSYDVNGNRVRDYDSFNRLVEQALYDNSGHQLQHRHMDKGESWSLLDVLGGQLLRWDARGYSFSTVYDALRREIEKRVRKGAETPRLTTKITYGDSDSSADPAKNLKGQIWKVQDQAGVHINTGFDIRGRCIEKSFQSVTEYKAVIDWTIQHDMEPTIYVQSFIYDSHGQVMETQDAQGNKTRRTFTRLGHVCKVDFLPVGSTEWDALLLSATFTADGLPLETRHGNKAVTAFEYDQQTRNLVSQVTTRETRSGSGPKRRLEDISHVYDCVGRRIGTSDASEQAKYFSGSCVKPVREFTYDAIGRLISATGRAQFTTEPRSGTRLKPHDAMSGSTSQRGVVDGNQLYNYLEMFEYDLEGNILSMTHEAPDYSGVTGWTRRYFYEEPSQLDDSARSNRLSRTVIADVEERYGYYGDDGLSGCMTSLPQFSELEWDMNHMLSSSSTQRVQAGSTPERAYYIYDHAGNRIRKVTDSFASAGETPRKQKESLYWGCIELQSRPDDVQLWLASVDDDNNTDHPLAVIESSSFRHSQRPLYRIRVGDGMELDLDAQLISYEEYSPFGNVVYSAVYQEVEASRVYRFADYEHDRETGLYHCGSRYYCPWLGRWTSPDPLGDVDGPNLFAYVGNDPVNKSDPAGTSGVFSSWRLVTSLFKPRFHSVPIASMASSSKGRDFPASWPLTRGLGRYQAFVKQAHFIAGMSPMTQDSAAKYASPPRGTTRVEQHHIYASQWEHIFRRAGIDKDLVTINVDSKVHDFFDNVHNKGWETKMTSLYRAEFPAASANLSDGKLANLLRKEHTPEATAFKTYVENNVDYVHDQLQQQMWKNLDDTGVPREEVPAHSQPYKVKFGGQYISGDVITRAKLTAWEANKLKK